MSQVRLTAADFAFGDDDDEEEEPMLPGVADSPGLSLNQGVVQSPEQIRSADEPSTVMSPPPDVYNDNGKTASDSVSNLKQIFHIMEQSIMDFLVHTRRTASSLSLFQTDETLMLALNRRLRFRGRSLLHERPHYKASKSGRLLGMMNKTKKVVNESTNINQKSDENTLLSEILSASNSENGSVKARVTDPCNSFVFPLRFVTLETSLIKNLELHWPHEMVVEISDAKHNQVDNFDFHKWKSEESYLQSLQHEAADRIIVICGYVVTWKQASEAHLKDVSRQYSLPYFPKPPSILPDDDHGILGFFSGSGLYSINIYTHPKTGLDPKEIVSGLPCALRGIAVPGNSFVVLEVLWPTPEPSQWPAIVQKPLHDMVFISGLNFGDSIHNPVEFELFRDWLLGLLGGTSEQVDVVAPKRKLFIVGDSFGLSFHSKEQSAEEIKRLRRAAVRLDDFINSLADVMEIFIIPGRSDPTERVLPMRPFQPILLQKSFQRSNVHRLQDPCRMKLIVDMEDPGQYLDVVLSSGENVAAIKNITGDVIPSSVMAENTLKWAHLNPASPDIYPVNGTPTADVFAISDRAPHLYILGNQSFFSAREYRNTKIVSVPKFSLSNEAICLNLVNGNYRISSMQFSLGDVADSF